MAIGICAISSNTNSLPGLWGSKSYGYHSDDGLIYAYDNHDPEIAKITEKYDLNDTVGCFMSTTDPYHRTVRFARNGEPIGTILDPPPFF